MPGLGLLKWCIAMITCLPIWVGTAVMLAFTFIRNPGAFLWHKDRTGMRFEDPCPGLEHEYLEVNGIRLHVVVGGRDQKPKSSKKLMLFVHGFPEAWFSWRHQIEAFKDEYVVAAIDLRGYGESDKPPGVWNYSMQLLVEDLTGVIQGLGYKRAIVVAHDWGGVIAWNFAALHQDMVESLIVMAAPPSRLYLRNQDSDQKKRSRYVWMFQAPLLPELVISNTDFAAVDQMFRGESFGVKTPGAISSEDVERYKAGLAKPGALTAGLNYYRAAVAAAAYRNAPRIPKIKGVPTLVLWGDSDVALGPQLLKGLETCVEDAEVHTLEKCSHWVQQDKPDDVNRLIRVFLADSTIAT